MLERRCPYFTVRVDSVPMAGLHRPLRIPTYQCALVDVMRTRLRSLPDSDALINALEHTAPDGTCHAMCGPDMKSLSANACTQTRCQQLCLPAFIDMMTDLGLDPTPPQADQSQ